MHIWLVVYGWYGILNFNLARYRFYGVGFKVVLTIIRTWWRSCVCENEGGNFGSSVAIMKDFSCWNEWWVVRKNWLIGGIMQILGSLAVEHNIQFCEGGGLEWLQERISCGYEEWNEIVLLLFDSSCKHVPKNRTIIWIFRWGGGGLRSP